MSPAHHPHDNRQCCEAVQTGVRLALVLLACVGLASPAAGQSAPSSSPPDTRSVPATPRADPDQLPISFDRIKQELEHPPAIDLELTRPIFRAEVVERRPKWLTSLSWIDKAPMAPAPTTPEWHREFINMVTPPQAQPWGAFRGTDLLQVAATSLVQALVTQALVPKVRNAAQNRRAAAARQEVDQALEAWRREQEAAGRNPDAQTSAIQADPKTPSGDADPAPPPETPH